MKEKVGLASSLLAKTQLEYGFLGQSIEAHIYWTLLPEKYEEFLLDKLH